MGPLLGQTDPDVLAPWVPQMIHPRDGVILTHSYVQTTKQSQRP